MPYGNILQGYGAASVTVTTTNLVGNSAASQSLISGWTSGIVDNYTTNNYADYAYAGQFTTTSSARQIGRINTYVIASFDNTPTFPATSAGTLGTESGVVTFTVTNQLFAHARLLSSITTTATNGEIYTFGQTGIAALFNGLVPTHHCLFVTNNAATTTAAGLAATCVLWYTPIIGKYT